MTALATNLSVDAARTFGGTQAQGAYSAKDATDLMELTLNTVISRNPLYYDPTVDAACAAKIAQKLSAVVAALPTQTRRTAEMESFQQFSTPPHLAYVAAWVANMRRGDVVLEPSAGVGGLAVFALNAGAQVYVNELAPRRSALLRRLPFTGFFQENGEQINNVLPDAIQPSIVIMNPPFSASPSRTDELVKMAGAMHLESALKRLQPGGRLVAILGRYMNAGHPFWKRIPYRIRANVAIPGREYRKYGTNYDVQLVVIDKVPPAGTPITDNAESVVHAISLLAALRDRPTIDATIPLDFPEPSVISDPIATAVEPLVKAVVTKAGALTDAVFEPYRPQRLKIAGATPHPTDLVQSAAMASVLPPEPTYTPMIPKAIIEQGMLSDAQLEAVVYAGQAHQQFLEDGSRKGFFVGDGTGVGKGRILAAIIMDDFNRRNR